MLLKVVKYILIFFALVFVVINLILGYYGVSSIALTVIAYVFVWFIGCAALNKFLKQNNFRKNLLTLFSSLLFSLFIGELYLKYFFKLNLSANELNGSPFYIIPYGNPQIEKAIRYFGHQEKDLRLSNHVAYTEEYRGGNEFRYLHKYNSIGLRGPDPITDSNFITIVTLGDSYTEGSGTPQDSTWTFLLERLLNNDHSLHLKKIQCINGGISSSELISEYVVLDKLLLKFHPKIVLLCINSTDISDLIQNGGWERYSHLRSAPWWAYIYQFSYITRAIVQSIEPIDWLYLTKEKYEKEKAIAIKNIENTLENRYLPLSKKGGFKLITILHPMRSELQKDCFPLAKLALTLKNHKDIETINLFELFQEEHIKGNLDYSQIYWPLDGHHNSKGYLLWATLVKGQIANNLDNI